MDSSKFCNIIATTRLLPHFSPQNITSIKSCVFSQLGCQNEAQFLCKALQSLCKTMSVESTAIIRNKAIEIADLQPMTQKPSINTNNINTSDTSDNPPNINDHTDNMSDMTVYKFIQQQYNDPLSQLHSDIIDYFGTFLSKKQSIEFGYLNKQLYIETQKHSYLLKRCKDRAFLLNANKIAKLFWAQNNICNTFSYSFPTSLRVDFWSNSPISKINDFNLFFRRLNSLACDNLACLEYIPWEILLNKDHNFYSSQESRDKLQRLKISESLGGGFEETIKKVNKFVSKFNDFKNNISNNNDNVNNYGTYNKQRKIKELELDIHPHYNHNAKAYILSQIQHVIKSILVTLGNICESICFHGGLLTISTFEELKTIFHKNLKNLTISTTKIDIIIPMKDCINNHKNTNNNHVNDIDSELAKLESMELNLTGDNENITNSITISVLSNLDKFSLRKWIKCYTICWSSIMNYFRSHTRNIDHNNLLNGLNKIFFQDYDKHSLLEKIIIQFEDETDLSMFATLLLYFNQHYKQLFVERKFYLKYFKQIEIEFIGIVEPCDRDDAILQEYKPMNESGLYIEHEKIFCQNCNVEYPVSLKTVEINNVKQGIDQFGIVYQNVFQWLKSIQMQSSEDSRWSIEGCKVVFNCG